MTDPDDLMADLADGLRRRVAERALAEGRLAGFVFREGAEDSAGQAPVGSGDWRHFVSRTLAAAGEPGTLDLLERLASRDETLRTLARDHQAGLDGGLATVDWIGGLAAAGLVGRDLETGRVGLTVLGSAVLAFALEWERRAAGPAPGSDRGQR